MVIVYPKGRAPKTGAGVQGDLDNGHVIDAVTKSSLA